MNQYLEIIIRAILAFTWLFIYTKWIGRRLISHNSYHLFVLSIVLGTICGNMAFNIKIQLSCFLLSLFVISGIGYILTKLSLKSPKAGALISGKPMVIIENGILLEENMQKCKFSREALDQCLRAKDIFNIEEVAQALLEVDGTLSVLKKKEYRSLTLKELKTLFPEGRIH
jgi:uncharacterized membrane protein YcaP (DUF421 family)